MPDLTTAQRLSAYRDELLAAGFAARDTWELVQSAAPALYEDLTVQADLDDTDSHAVVNVRMVAQVDRESLDQAVEKVRRFVSAGDEDGRE